MKFSLHKMKHHTKIYFDHFGYTGHEFIHCEIPGCDLRAVDVCHIDARGMGGDPQGKKDVIENLMGKCRKHHDQYGDKKTLKYWLRVLHIKFMMRGKRPPESERFLYKCSSFECNYSPQAVVTGFDFYDSEVEKISDHLASIDNLKCTLCGSKLVAEID